MLEKKLIDLGKQLKKISSFFLFIMSLSIELILTYIILIPFIIINIIFSIGLLFQKTTGIFLRKAFKLEQKDTKNKVFSFINLFLWIIIGLVNVLNLDAPFSIGALLVFIAFHSGLSLSKRLIFGIHDIKIMKSQNSENRIKKLIIRVVKIGIIIESMFLLSWGILYRYLNVSIKSNFGIEVNLLVLVLWIVGFIYGIIISVIQSSFSKQFLLKNEIGMVLLFSGELLKDKIMRNIK